MERERSGINEPYKLHEYDEDKQQLVRLRKSAIWARR
jgi:hypothetical protein